MFKSKSLQKVNNINLWLQNRASVGHPSSEIAWRILIKFCIIVPLQESSEKMSVILFDIDPAKSLL
jgi:hypothetical protein